MSPAKQAVHVINEVFDYIFIILMLLLLLFAFYAHWDSQQVYTQADPVQYLQYKPSPPEMLPFEELQEINPEVIGWLTIYDTNIDYPLVQSEDDFKYLNHNAKGEPEGSGAIFLDSANNPKFSDFNTIIYGHHMSHHEMFGDLDLFLDEDFWNEHEYGNLIYDSQNHGLQFIAILQCNAFDYEIYHPGINGEEARVLYINHIYETAKFVRGIDTETLRQMQKSEATNYTTRTSPVTPDDHIVLMSTCSADMTNGRFILVAKILDHPVENPFPDEEHTISGIDTAKITARIWKLSVWMWIAIIIGLIILVLLLYLLSTYLYKKKLEEENAYDQNTEDV